MVKSILNRFYYLEKKIGKQNFILLVFILIFIVITGLYQTFSLFTSSEGISLIDGIKTYKFILGADNTENAVTIAAGASKNIAITVSNKDKIKLQYGIYYTSNSDLTDVDLGYKRDTDYLPNGSIDSNEDYIVTIQIDNHSSIDITISFGIIYGLETGGDLTLTEGQQWLEKKWNFPLNEVEVGSYVAYQGNSGCTGESCRGQNANYVSDSEMGYCNNSDNKFTSNGWRVGYIQNNTAYLISAGSPECLCTASNGTFSDSCSDYESTEGIPRHLDNLNQVSLKYCNPEYVYGEKCNSASVWNISDTDFQIIANRTLNSCFSQNTDSTCGYENALINNGSFYWFANPYSSTSLGAFYFRPLGGIYYTGTNYSLGVRPVLRLDSNIVVTSGTGTYEDPYQIKNIEISKNNANEPNLDDGNLIPVYYDDTEEVWKKADSSNTDKGWYDYNNKNWANAILVSDSAKRSNYQSADVGTSISDTDIAAFYVWIPRFKYRVWNITRQAGEESTYAYAAYTNGIDIEWESGTNSTGNVTCTYDTTTIESDTNLSDTCIYNETDTITTTSGNRNYTNAWYTHPAFTFGGEAKTGFWIGKFETTGTASAPTILPDLSSLRSQTVSEQFTTSKVFQSYGLSSNINAHMLTNLEWGAVGYLTYSKYGLCNDVTCRGDYINNSSGYYTGRSSGDISGSENLNLSTVYSGNTTSTDKYNATGYYTYKGYFIDYNGNITTTKDTSKLASTTGNITGVYDMSGGAYEYVMGNMVDSSGVFYPSSSGTNWNGSTTLDSKYYNSYSYSASNHSTQSAFNRARLGDGTAETIGTLNSTKSGWKLGSGISGTFSFFVNGSYSWFNRGGAYFDDYASLFFYSSYYGNSYSPNADGSNGHISFRSSLS